MLSKYLPMQDCGAARRPTLFAYGFPMTMLANLIRDGLATTQRETLRVGNRQVRAAFITDRGLRTLQKAFAGRTG